MLDGVAKLLGIVLIAGTFSICAPVHAQSEVEAKGVGVIGGVIGGAEVVLAVESIFRVKPLWTWIVLPTLGAGAGGVGGYYLQKKSKGGAIALLITSMVAIIPTVIAASSARSFHPDDVNAQSGDGADQYKVFSFEQNPNGENGENNNETITEIEAKPEGVPDEPMGPSVPNEFQEKPTPADPPNAPIETDETDAPAIDPTSLYRTEKQERIAHLSSGALLHMNRKFHLGMGIPAVDVLPSVIESSDAMILRSGVEIRLPLLRIDLP